MIRVGTACPERERLIEELTAAISSLAALSAEQIRAVIDGKLEGRITAAIDEVQMEKTEAWRRLENHIHHHRCAV